MIHTYRAAGTEFEVGYYRPYSDGNAPEWITLSTHATENLAIKRVNALNGGDGSPAVWGR